MVTGFGWAEAVSHSICKNRTGVAVGLLLLTFSWGASSFPAQDQCPVSSHVTGTSLIVDASMCKAPVSDLIKKLEPQLQARLDQMDSFALLPPTGADNERDMRQAWKKTCRAVEGDPSRISARTFLKHYEDSVLMRSMGSILAKHGFPRVSIDNFYPIRGSSHDPCDGTVMPPAIWFGRPRPAMRQGR